MNILLQAVGVLVLSCYFGNVSAQEQCKEPNVAVIVVASVFGTLAVVFITLGIIFFLLWKRRRDLSRPSGTPTKKNNLPENDHNSRTPDRGFSNPAFSSTDGHGDISLAEEGVGGYVRCREHVAQEKKSVRSNGNKDSSRKTWTSLPNADLPPGPTHNMSLGSLDDHYLNADPEVSSVWLQSQDFIGLGFNIAGSMRDGIFVSQVHNRGPAVESGKFKVGDRILSVTISFENMVYEDALTILSYASPYPVKVTLQTERTSKIRKPSDAYSNLSHPLYRSQSVDTLNKINKDTAFVPQRSLSVASQGILEDRLNKSNNTKFSIEKESFNESQEINKDAVSVPKQQNLTVNDSVTVTQAEINTHSDNNVDDPSPVVDDVFTPVKVGNEESPPNLSSLPPPINVTMEDDAIPPPEPLVPPPPLDFDTVDNTDPKPISAAASEFASLFDTLNEQDKLDMLRLSYEDPENSVNTSCNTTDQSLSENTLVIDTSVTEGETSNDTLIDLEQRSPPPVKPERRKKKSSSGSISSTEVSPREINLPPPDVIEDAVVSLSVATEQSAPPTGHFKYDGSEITEEVIMPEKKSRDVSILSKSIEFSVVDNARYYSQHDGEVSPRDDNKTLVDYSLSDMENTLRPQTPENPSIEEEIITPVQNKRGALESSLKLFENSDLSITPTSGNDSGQASGDNFDKNCSKIANTTIGSVDFNLNMTSNPNLFSTPYPNRNAKEASSGMSYDISMMELNDIETQMKKPSKELGKGGISFEIRDDVISGGTVLTSVSKPQKSDAETILRTMSYQENLGQTEKIKLTRPSSFKVESSQVKDDNENSLEWSGKRLVRSGSFSEIPQDIDKDWIDHNKLDNEDEDTNKELNSSEESLEQSDKKGLSKTTLFRARENLTNLSSDNSDSLQSITSSSRGSTPPPPYSTNGNEDHGLGTSPETTPIKAPLNINELSTTSELNINTNVDMNVIPTSKFEGNSNYTVTVDAGHDDEADC